MLFLLRIILELYYQGEIKKKKKVTFLSTKILNPISVLPSAVPKD